MPSLSAKSMDHQTTENAIARKTPPLSTLIRKRAHQHFSNIVSVQSDQPLGSQRIDHPTKPVTESRPNSAKKAAVAPKVVANGSQNSGMEGQRALRTKVSMSSMRQKTVSSALQPRSPNKNTQETAKSGAGILCVTSTSDKQPQAILKKRDVITASPVMSAMLQSHRLKRIQGSGATGDRRTTIMQGEFSSPSVIDGSGIKVKSAALKRDSGDARTSSASKVPRVKPQMAQMASNTSPRTTFVSTPSQSNGLKASRQIQTSATNGRPQSGHFVLTRN